MQYVPAANSEWIHGRGYRKQIILNEGDLNCEGTLVQMVVIEPHTEVPFHHHKKMTEVFHVIEGKGKMTVGGTEFDLKPGDTLTTEPGDFHNAVNNSDAPLRYIVFKTNATVGDSFWPAENEQ